MGFDKVVSLVVNALSGSGGVFPSIPDPDADGMEGGFSGKPTTGEHDYKYRDESGTEVFIVEGLEPAYGVAAYSNTIDEFCQNYVARVVLPLLSCAAAKIVALTFDYGSHDMKDEESQARKQARGTSRQRTTPVQAYLFSDKPEERKSLFRALLAYMMASVPLAHGVTLMICGLTHLSELLPSAGQMPLCVRLSEDGTKHELVHPSRVIGTRRRGGMPFIPADADWFSQIREADDMVKFLMLVFMYWVPPLDALTQDEEAELPSPNIMIVTEDSNILIELLALLSMYMKLNPRMRIKRLGKIRYYHKTIAGYLPKPSVGGIDGEAKPSKDCPVKMGEVYDLKYVANLWGVALDARFDDMGLTGLCALLVTALFRKHDYMRKNYIEGFNSMKVFKLMLSASKSELANRQGYGHVFSITHTAPNGRTPTMFDAFTVQIDYALFSGLVMHLRGPGENVVNDAEIRGEAARMTLWLSKALSITALNFRMPKADATIMFNGHTVPAYGYARPNGICSPVLQMPCAEPTADGELRCLDLRGVYEIHESTLENDKERVK